MHETGEGASGGKSWLRRQGLSWRIGLAYAVLFSIIVAAQLTAVVRRVPIADVVRDVVEVTGASVYTGFLSQVGLFLWSATAAVCFVAYQVIRDTDRSRARFLLASSVLTTILLIDDAFTVHDRLLPHLGLPALAVYTMYGLVLLAYLWRFWEQIADGPRLLLLLALTFGGAAGVLDVLDHTGVTIVAETGMKFMGLGSWLLYFGQFSVLLLRNRHSDEYARDAG